MEDPGPNEDDHDHFFDAFDEFLFYDSSDAFEPEPSVSQSTISQLESNISQTTPYLRRISSAHHRRRMSGIDSKATLSTSEITQIQDGKTTISRERKYKLHRNFEENEKDCEKTESSRVRASPVQNTEDSHAASSTGKNVQVDDSSSSNPLVFLAELVIKAIGFQINLFISVFTFPAWLLYKFCVFAIDPFQGMRHGRDYLMGRFGWSLLLSVYVASILCGLLVAAFVVSGFVMRYLVEEPIRMEEALNFDYTKNSPVAFVPIKSCPSSACVNCYEKIEVGKKRGLHVIPPNHKLQVTVMLTLPESEYNRNLGVFQVRVDFLSAEYRRLASASRTCMLQFKSMPIRLLLTFFKMAPLVAGYLSESQTLNVHFSGFTEGDEPTACLKVTIEQRAEYRPGAGIPEIYASSLILESELPLVKRILWYWKKTVFIWISMTVFLMELVFTLICCRPIILPRVRPRDGSASGSATQDNVLIQS
ncbi:Seipin-2 [Vitis vinifera]|uniref:Seipin-2 n=1 Tax=Vitis vinifera TaxID=29760 RepID=A0A438HHD4_VITVI|nr:Seipin-2 [Vitis vinifera]